MKTLVKIYPVINGGELLSKVPTFVVDTTVPLTTLKELLSSFRTDRRVVLNQLGKKHKHLKPVSIGVVVDVIINSRFTIKVKRLKSRDTQVLSISEFKINLSISSFKVWHSNANSFFRFREKGFRETDYGYQLTKEQSYLDIKWLLWYNFSIKCSEGKDCIYFTNYDYYIDTIVNNNHVDDIVLMKHNTEEIIETVEI